MLFNLSRKLSNFEQTHDYTPDKNMQVADIDETKHLQVQADKIYPKLNQTINQLINIGQTHQRNHRNITTNNAIVFATQNLCELLHIT